ncbi:hypothetical protein Cs7R123_03160 [Catellatospora sp. TT07R-123]|uniref:heavy-metal-associated domain-containing protein n=1 Tax=Catellatospora sp. TT07R-123 TaxID=2733863 RepID=UPI001B1650A5|nr:heavy-metal-associated domain-containing protein [Catellatospora sp. TT07R-123]GHJ42974.1 hypothetical protein Cs7R123_03160 [Catellatospora sp. TT07R-123]
MSTRHPAYDRTAAAAVLSRLAAPGLFPGNAARHPYRQIAFHRVALRPEPGRSLTLPQRAHLERAMAPCRPEQVVSATDRIIWTDSSGVVNTGYCRSGALGPSTPIAAREAFLALSQALADNQRLAADSYGLSDADLALLAATTTDQEPVEIFRTGADAAARALAQHALIADQAGHADPVGFAAAMLEGGLFTVIASTWYWGLQAATYRRGMIPAAFERGGRLRYSRQTTALLAAMKRRTVAEADRIMREATGAEGLTVAQALHKYHADLDLVSRQYALMDPGTRPRCLAAPPTAGGRDSIVEQTAAALVAVFTEVLPRLHVEDLGPPADAAGGHAEVSPVFAVPDMVCRHCRVTVTTALETHGADVGFVDLATKRVVAVFTSPGQREAVFATIRQAGYTVVTD